MTLALGIGANSAMFALADATLMRPLPYPDADRLVMVWERAPTFPRVPMAPATLLDLEEQTQSFDGAGGGQHGDRRRSLARGARRHLQSVDRQYVTARFFDALGVKPVAGRTFVPSEAKRPTTSSSGGTRDAAAGCCDERGSLADTFGGDPSLVGRDIRLNGEPFTVVGIVPDDVQLQRLARIWSLMPEANPSSSRGAFALQVVGRLKPGVYARSCAGRVGSLRRKTRARLSRQSQGLEYRTSSRCAQPSWGASCS